jgi:hypothetical protein
LIELKEKPPKSPVAFLRWFFTLYTDFSMNIYYKFNIFIFIYMTEKITKEFQSTWELVFKTDDALEKYRGQDKDSKSKELEELVVKLKKLFNEVNQ